MTTSLPPSSVATLSLDLDNTWAYLRTRGDTDWAQAPSVLPLVADRLLPLLDELGTHITFFVVGADVATPDGAAVVRELAAAGHEIGSHSWLHRGELSALPADEIADDLERTANVIAEATGSIPRGFRSPSFGTSPALLSTLLDAGYSYDASILPTSLGPLLRLYHKVRIRQGEDAPAEQASATLFGPTSNVWLPLEPFRWQTRSGTLLELPVSSLPLFRTPVHMSYLQAVAARSPRLAETYLSLTLRALRGRGVPPSFLLHPTDVIDVDDAPRLDFFPGMARPWQDKLAQVRDALEALMDGTSVLSLGDYAGMLSEHELQVRDVAGDAASKVRARR